MLDNVNKNNPFKTPENYFDDFHKEMMDRINTEKKPRRIVSLWKKVAPWSAIAAILCGVIISINTITSDKNSGLISEGTKKDSQLEAYALSDDDYFLMFLEDEITNDSFKDNVYGNIY